MNERRVIVVIEGGNVQSVYVPAGVVVEVRDYDNAENYETAEQGRADGYDCAEDRFGDVYTFAEWTENDDTCPRCQGIGEEPGAPLSLEDGRALCSECSGTGHARLVHNPSSAPRTRRAGGGSREP